MTAPGAGAADELAEVVKAGWAEVAWAAFARRALGQDGAAMR
jgi:hypothetical protein